MRAFVNSSLALHSYFALYHDLRNLTFLESERERERLSHLLQIQYISGYFSLSLMMILSKKSTCIQYYTMRHLHFDIRRSELRTCVREDYILPNVLPFSLERARIFANIISSVSRTRRYGPMEISSVENIW